MAIPDPDRRLLDRAGLVAEYLDTTGLPIGHGFTADNVDDGTAYWIVRPVAGVPLRLIGLDTNPDGPGAGLFRTSVRDDFLVPELRPPRPRASWSSSRATTVSRGLPVEDGGIADQLVAGYPNVILSVVGHSHGNRAVPRGQGGGGFWEVEDQLERRVAAAGAALDWSRTATVRCRSSAPCSTRSRRTGRCPRGAACSPRRPAVRLGTVDGQRTDVDRNVELIVPLPPGVTLPAGRAGVESLTLP